MRRFIALIAVAALAMALAGCSQPATPSTPSGGTSAAPVPADVWATLSTKGYQSWQAAPGYETTQPAKGPHGAFVKIFVDPNVATTLAGGTATAWPVGSMVVKDAYDTAGKPVQVEYMQKTDAGWYFASFGPDGSVNKEGVKAEPCQACHVSGSDSIKGFKLP